MAGLGHRQDRESCSRHWMRLTVLWCARDFTIQKAQCDGERSELYDSFGRRDGCTLLLFRRRKGAIRQTEVSGGIPHWQHGFAMLVFGLKIDEF